MLDTKPCPSKNGKGISSSSDLKMVESGKDTFFATELVNFDQGWKPIVNLAVPQRTRNSNKMTTLQIIPFAISVGPTFRPSSWLFLPLFFFESPPFPWNQWRTTNPPRHWNRYPSLWSRLPSVHYLGRLQPSENDFLSVFARILMDKRWTFSSHVKKQKKTKNHGVSVSRNSIASPHWYIYGHPVGWKMTKMNSLPFTHLPFNIFASTKILTSPLQKNSTKQPPNLPI